MKILRRSDKRNDDVRTAAYDYMMNQEIIFQVHSPSTYSRQSSAGKEHVHCWLQLECRLFAVGMTIQVGTMSIVNDVTMSFLR